MQDTTTEKRVDRLEEALLEMVYQSRKTEMNLDRLAKEMRDFKDEMLIFKDEMKDFKDEMRVFKDEMRAITKEMNKKWGDLANKLGTLAEDIVAPGISRAIEQAFGLDVKEVSVRRKRKMGERSREYDVIAV